MRNLFFLLEGNILRNLKKGLQTALTPNVSQTAKLNSKKSVRKLLVMRSQLSYRLCLSYCHKLGIKPVKKIKTLNAILLHVSPTANLIPLKKHAAVKRIETDHKFKLHLLRKQPLLAKTKPVSLIRMGACASVQTNEIIPWGVGKVKANKVWQQTEGNQIRVAVLDTGIAQHPDLQTNGSFNAIEAKAVDDQNGHGTHVAGTITALRNKFGVVGVAPKVKLYAIKAFDAQGVAYNSDIVEGIDWCMRNKIQIINMSFGSNRYSSSLHDIIRRAYKQGIIMVASCGNSGKKSSQIDYPARFPETISVAATTQSDKITTFSSRGKGINVAAPGQGICSTYLNQTYTRLNGTSMAAPHVTGSAALILSRFPKSTPQSIRLRLQKSANRLHSYTSEEQGAGLINVEKASK